MWELVEVDRWVADGPVVEVFVLLLLLEGLFWWGFGDDTCIGEVNVDG